MIVILTKVHLLQEGDESIKKNPNCWVSMLDPRLRWDDG